MNDVQRVRAALAADTVTDPGIPVDRVVEALEELRPEVLARFGELGFDETVAQETLADVARKVEFYGTAEAAGPDVGIGAGWLLRLARADVVALGRLQFERVPRPDGRAVHVPEAGPLDPAAVDDSLARAVEVFGEGEFTCTTWLLDPLLPPALGEGSRITGFARRFEVGAVERGDHGDRAAAKFVFRRTVAEVLDPVAVHPRTRLERCVAEHLRAGGHWSEPRGALRR
ncbi:hypothetical protein [Kineococcus sp. SYSU DK003]|uniref:hypothetical protein n=1 Tax=Kineococcus sp. SYSU DK003 TaxID=3383124 RepID=UPI003D7D2EF4